MFVIVKKLILPKCGQLGKCFISTKPPTPVSPESALIQPKDYQFSKILVFNKVSRFEFEKRRYSHLNEKELKEKLTKSGSNYEKLLKHHDEHYKALEKILSELNSYGINVKVIQRFNYTLDDIKWADCILTAGGDGTFLLAAAKIDSMNKPIFGVNTDVENSEGYLLLPEKQSKNFSKTFQKLLKGHFKWLMRTRIRITIETNNGVVEPIELHDQLLNERENRFIEHVEEHRALTTTKDQKVVHKQPVKKNSVNGTRQVAIPYRALNEVFIGESLSARVSYYKMSIDDKPYFKQKSSGIILCTGTGSTSWCYNIHKMNKQAVRDIVKILNSKTGNKISEDDQFIHDITKQFNDSIVFDPNLLNMSYTIRDPVINRIYTNETTRGFAKKVVIQSRCYDACLVVDGGLSYQFNIGAKAIFGTHPEDALKTIIVDDD